MKLNSRGFVCVHQLMFPQEHAEEYTCVGCKRTYGSAESLRTHKYRCNQSNPHKKVNKERTNEVTERKKKLLEMREVFNENVCS